MSAAIESRFKVNTLCDQAFGSIYHSIAEMTRIPLQISKEIPHPGYSPIRKPSYVMLEYRVGFLGLGVRRIELHFTEKGNATITTLKWHYPTFENEIRSNGGFTRMIWEQNASKARQETTWFVEELKSRVQAVEVNVNEETAVKEIIKEKQIIVKIRCDHCGNLFDESLDRCSYCGADVRGRINNTTSQFVQLLVPILILLPWIKSLLFITT